MLDAPPSAWTRMPDAERKRRTRLYRTASDLAVLQMPAAVRGRVASEWNGALARSLANGTADIQKKDRIKVRAPKDART
jgi:hypothetical protein